VDASQPDSIVNVTDGTSTIPISDPFGISSNNRRLTFLVVDDDPAQSCTFLEFDDEPGQLTTNMENVQFWGWGWCANTTMTQTWSIPVLGVPFEPICSQTWRIASIEFEPQYSRAVVNGPEGSLREYINAAGTVATNVIWKCES
jgi:hypothetical protein